MEEEYVVLVDGEDNEIGFDEKSAAHIYPAKLHRAFSIFILDDRGQLLIQKRNHGKITWPGFWSNSCCSHPRPNEPIELAAQRRLDEELGFTCEVEFIFKFQYMAQFGTWGEHEMDHVFLGYHNGSIHPNPTEIDDFTFAEMDELSIDMEANVNKYTPWLRICFRRLLDHMVRV